MTPSLAVAIAKIEGSVEVIKAKVTNLEEESDTKHHQNTVAIEKLETGQVKINEAIVQINLKFARMFGWTAGAGAAAGVFVAIFTKIIEHVWK